MCRYILVYLSLSLSRSWSRSLAVHLFVSLSLPLPLSLSLSDLLSSGVHICAVLHQGLHHVEVPFVARDDKSRRALKARGDKKRMRISFGCLLGACVIRKAVLFGDVSGWLVFNDVCWLVSLYTCMHTHICMPWSIYRIGAHFEIILGLRNDSSSVSNTPAEAPLITFLKSKTYANCFRSTSI